MSIKLTPFPGNCAVHAATREVYYGKKATTVGCKLSLKWKLISTLTLQLK